MGTTAAQKKLFFNLRRETARIAAFEDGDLTPDEVTELGTRLGVHEAEVASLKRRMSMGGDASPNYPRREEGHGDWTASLANAPPGRDSLIARDADIPNPHKIRNGANLT